MQKTSVLGLDKILILWYNVSVKYLLGDGVMRSFEFGNPVDKINEEEETYEVIILAEETDEEIGKINLTKAEIGKILGVGFITILEEFIKGSKGDF